MRPYFVLCFYLVLSNTNKHATSEKSAKFEFLKFYMN